MRRSAAERPDFKWTKLYGTGIYSGGKRDSKDVKNLVSLMKEPMGIDRRAVHMSHRRLDIWSQPAPRDVSQLPGFHSSTMHLRNFAAGLRTQLRVCGRLSL